MFADESISKPPMGMWADPSENDEDSNEEFNKVFNNPDIK